MNAMIDSIRALAHTIHVETGRYVVYSEHMHKGCLAVTVSVQGVLAAPEPLDLVVADLDADGHGEAPFVHVLAVHDVAAWLGVYGVRQCADTVDHCVHVTTSTTPSMRRLFRVLCTASTVTVLRVA